MSEEPDGDALKKLLEGYARHIRLRVLWFRALEDHPWTEPDTINDLALKVNDWTRLDLKEA
jgi:hypothetical protein